MTSQAQARSSPARRDCPYQSRSCHAGPGRHAVRRPRPVAPADKPSRCPPNRPCRPTTPSPAWPALADLPSPCQASPGLVDVPGLVMTWPRPHRRADKTIPHRGVAIPADSPPARSRPCSCQASADQPGQSLSASALADRPRTSPRLVMPSRPHPARLATSNPAQPPADEPGRAVPTPGHACPTRPITPRPPRPTSQTASRSRLPLPSPDKPRPTRPRTTRAGPDLPRQTRIPAVPSRPPAPN